MKHKRYILLIALLTAVTSFAYGQRTAQATMRVSVKVVSGISATVDSGSDLTIGDTGINGKLGAVSLTGIHSNGILVSSDTELNLVNDEGDNVRLPVNVSNSASNDKMSLQFTGKEKGTAGKAYRGVYSGTLKTTIEYF